MEEKILFTEKQKFSQWWIWLVIIGINAIFIVAIIVQIYAKIPFGNNPMNDVSLIISAVATLLITSLIFTLRLDTKITNTGIYFKFFPFHLSFKFIAWRNIKKSYIRQYRPIGEYGGWGMKGIVDDKVYNVSGNIGLQLELENGKKILIGTKKSADIQTVIDCLGKN